MINNKKYAKAYTEVIEIISHFPQKEYCKIPSEKIEFYKANMDKNYVFKVNPAIDLSKQNISKEANAIIIMLYKEYFATEEQKIKIDKILENNQIKKEHEKRDKYNTDEIFKRKKKIEKNNENMSVVEYKETFFVKFKNFIFRLLHMND